MSKADNSTAAETNQQGQTIGRKGFLTRQKLMEAARKLLDVYSPVELTAVSIAKEAGTSSASFYMYFEDTRDILFALATEAGTAMSSIHEIVQQPWEPDAVYTHSLRLVETFNAIWHEHRQVLRFRNLEADRGDPRFEALRMNTYIPFIDKLARQIVANCPTDKPRPTLSQAFALASVVHAAMERLATTDPAVVARYVGVGKVNEAIAHMIQLIFNGGAPTNPPPTTAPRAAAKRARKR
jgi:AcrR family transcriptional regulator